MAGQFSLKVIRACDTLRAQPTPAALPQQSPAPHPLRTKLLVPFGRCVVNPADPEDVRTFIRKYVRATPEEFTPEVVAHIKTQVQESARR